MNRRNGHCGQARLADFAIPEMVLWQDLNAAIHDQQPVSGLTHNFYRYPARFAPSFAKQAILAFTRPGDLVFDPFMGGGTSIVEAKALGRHAVGTDISSLAVFLSQTKATSLSEHQLTRIADWGTRLVPKLNLHGEAARPQRWMSYQKNISDKQTWPIRKLLEMALRRLSDLGTVEERRFARCVLLRTGQWALDCREFVPSAEEVRCRLVSFLKEMIAGAREFSAVVESQESTQTSCLHRSAIGVEEEAVLRKFGAPKLVLTSPPYPGVHVLYHRWQVLGRRETPAPFWIAGQLDGAGASFYTFGGRHKMELREYFEQARRSFSSVAKVADNETLVVQMVAFSESSWQLPAYLEMMRNSGFEEVLFPALANHGDGRSGDGRSWRSVPNRKWYADAKGATSSSTEVVLFHKKSVS